MKFYKCNHCGNVIVKLEDSKVNVVCCNEQMEELIPNDQEASHEKHIPVIKEKENGVEVLVGEIEHPMVLNHYISFIVVETKNGFIQEKCNEKPNAFFNVKADDIIHVYAYCNLHGLWIK